MGLVRPYRKKQRYRACKSKKVSNIPKKRRRSIRKRILFSGQSRKSNIVCNNNCLPPFKPKSGDTNTHGTAELIIELSSCKLRSDAQPLSHVSIGYVLLLMSICFTCPCCLNVCPMCLGLNFHKDAQIHLDILLNINISASCCPGLGSMSLYRSP